MMTIPPKPPVPPQIFPRVCDHHPDGVQTALAWCCFKAEALNPAPSEDNSVDKQLKMQTNFCKIAMNYYLPLKHTLA